jgi:drug/metabolite transporter (DMT)-like permease
MDAQPDTTLIWTLWIANVLVDTVGQLAFKAAASGAAGGVGLARWRTMASRPWLWLGVGCYVAEFLVWLAFLSLVPLSEGVLLGCINIAAVMIAGRLFFAEKLTGLRISGILLITAGVALIGLA